MKVTVKEHFLDRESMEYRDEGDEFECTKERAEFLAEKGLVAPVQAKTRKTLKED